jgi:hypothetical protein
MFKQYLVVFGISLLLSLTVDAYGSTIAALPSESEPPISYNNSAYQKPTLSEIETFKNEKALNKDLINQYAEHINCNDDTMCSLVFAGKGLIRIDISSDGFEDSFKIDFIGLNTVREAVEAITPTPEPTPEPEEELVQEEEEESGGGSGSESEDSSEESPSEETPSEQTPEPEETPTVPVTPELGNPLFEGREPTPPQQQEAEVENSSIRIPEIPLLSPSPIPTDYCYEGFDYMIPNYTEVCGDTGFFG